MKRVNHYFAYGSNMEAARAAERMPGALDIGRAVLPGWRVVERLYADAVPAEGGTAEGVLYRIGQEELAALDRYEGYPGVYDRRVVTAFWRGRPVRAWVYVMTEVSVANRTGLRYPEWYRLLCRDGAKAHKLRRNAFLRPRAVRSGDVPRQALLPLGGGGNASCGRHWPNAAVAWPTPSSQVKVYSLFVDAELPNNPYVEEVLKTGRFEEPATLQGRAGKVMVLSPWAFEALDTILSLRTNRVRTMARVRTRTYAQRLAWRYAAR